MQKRSGTTAKLCFACPRLLVGVSIVLCSALLFGQSENATQASTSVQQNEPEIVSHETTTFKVRVNQVLLKVVVRDKDGNTVGNLTRDSFQVFDNGKPQTISSFALQKVTPKLSAPEEKSGQQAQPETSALEEPQHYIGYIFDDMHLGAGDLARVQQAASQYISAMSSDTRAAVFTTSGRTTLDFTDDRRKLLDTVAAIRQVMLMRNPDINPCPWMTYWAADRIINKNDGQVLQTLVSDTIKCLQLNINAPDISAIIAQATAIVQASARQEISNGDHDTRIAIDVVRNVIGRMALLPGQRTLVVISPGFLAQEDHYHEIDVVEDKAVRASVTIETLDARGLYTDPGLSAENNRSDSNILEYMRQSARQDEDVLAELADATGGTFFHNNNDLLQGFRQVAAPAEVVYAIAFSPQNLKLDGRFHNLKVTVKSTPKLVVHTRKGYYAPNHAEDQQTLAKEEIEDAIFSRDERYDIPMELHTQFFKSSDAAANVAVVTHVDLKPLSFRKDAGRNLNTVTVVSALFDRNGHFVTGQEKTIEFHMRDETLQRQKRTGIAIRSNFDVKPGDYLVRVVVRDTEGQLVSAKNDTVQIP